MVLFNFTELVILNSFFGSYLWSSRYKTMSYTNKRQYSLQHLDFFLYFISLSILSFPFLFSSPPKTLIVNAYIFTRWCSIDSLWFFHSFSCFILFVALTSKKGIFEFTYSFFCVIESIIKALYRIFSFVIGSSTLKISIVFQISY